MLAGVGGCLRVCTVLLGGLEGLGEDEWWEVFTPSSTPIFLLAKTERKCLRTFPLSLE